jgi:hypothetical protein
MSVYVRAFKASDLKAFTPIEELVPAEIENKELAVAIEKSDLAVTGIRNGQIVGCGGVHPMFDRPGEGEIWIRLSKTCQKHPFDTLRWLKDGLDIIEENFGFHTLYAPVQRCFKKGAKMIEYFGFKKMETTEKDWFIYYKRIA